MKLLEKNPAIALLEQYCQAYKRRDLSAILNMFTKNCNVWGTAVDEYRVGLQALEIQHHRDWSQSDQNEIRIISFITMPGDALFAAAICQAIITIDGKEHIFDHLRGTIGVSKENGEWKIAHMHASFPDFRNDQDGSFPKV